VNFLLVLLSATVLSFSTLSIAKADACYQRDMLVLKTEGETHEKCLTATIKNEKNPSPQLVKLFHKCKIRVNKTFEGKTCMPHMHAWIASSIFYEERHYDLWDDYEKGRITGEYLSTQRERLWEIQREHGKKLLADGIAEMDRYNRAAREDTARWQASRSK
jgi:hypothetical protein